MHDLALSKYVNPFREGTMDVHGANLLWQIDRVYEDPFEVGLFRARALIRSLSPRLLPMKQGTSLTSSMSSRRDFLISKTHTSIPTIV